MLAIVAKLKAKPGLGAELAQKMVEIATEVRKEPGNHAYSIHLSKADPDLVMVYEQYTDEDALAAHRQNMKEMRVDLSALLAGRPEIEQFELRG